MPREYEPPLNPPGIDAPDRKIKRQYIPMREYDDIEANGVSFVCMVEVESYGCHDEDIRVSYTRFIRFWDSEHNYHLIDKFLDSYISPTGPTWRELIEREICRQARELPGTAWQIEYEGDGE